MYPGKAQDGLSIHFRSGLTLVIGANGLGKSTLVNILYRLLTGPFEVPGLETGRELGTANLEAKPLQRDARLELGRRVADGAREAVARIAFRVGTTTVELARSLHDLSLRSLSIDGEVLQPNGEDEYQKRIISLVGVWSFGDWILILQHLLFYFESRRELVWDASAQRELLRALFLPVDAAKRWSQEAREILVLDSSIRNLSAVRSRLETDVADHTKQLQTLPEVRAQLSTLEKLQVADRQSREALNDEIDSSDALRHSCRQRQMTLSQLREERYRELEREKLIAITTQFPTQSETTRYILSQLMSESMCLVCGNKSTKAQRTLNDRLATGHCIVCATAVKVRRARSSRGAMNVLQTSFDAIEAELAEATESLSEAEARYERVSAELARFGSDITERSRTIGALVAKLPPEEAALHDKRSDLMGLRALEDEQRAKVAAKRAAFKDFVAEKNAEIVKRANDIKKRFHEFAQGFLVEECALVWQLQKGRLGQLGDTFDFPGFQLSMSGAGFAEPVRRSGPEQVSASQREFIDLAFRML